MLRTPATAPARYGSSSAGRWRRCSELPARRDRLAGLFLSNVGAPGPTSNPAVVESKLSGRTAPLPPSRSREPGAVTTTTTTTGDAEDSGTVDPTTTIGGGSDQPRQRQPRPWIR